MLPIPYVAVESGTIEFNAKITSVTESHSEQNFEQVVEASASAKAWFVNASVHSKTAYQKKSSTSDKEERTFDMHVMVQVKNQDMPAGTERLMTLLENVIEEKQSSGGTRVLTLSADTTATATTVTVTGDVAAVMANATFMLGGVVHTISAVAADTQTLTFAPALAAVAPAGTTISVKNAARALGTRSRMKAPLASKSAPGLLDPRTTVTTVVTEMVIDGDISRFTAGSKLSIGGVNYMIAGLDPTHNKLLLSSI